MKTENIKEFKLIQCESKFVLPAMAESYIAPDIEILNIELQQNFFGSGDLDDMDGSDW